MPEKTAILFCAFTPARKPKTHDSGSVRYLSLKRSPVSFPMDEGLKYDPLFQRHTNRVLARIDQIQTGRSAYYGIKRRQYRRRLSGLENGFAAHRLVAYESARICGTAFEQNVSFLPEKTVKPVTDFAERKIMDGAVLYYKMPKVILAPNQELLDQLTSGTGRTGQLMLRGVDTEVYSPANERTVNDNIIRFGFVGRLRAEKTCVC
jgi:phosphatidylinositol alpha 1,6-mannosyltransferase